MVFEDKEQGLWLVIIDECICAKCFDKENAEKALRLLKEEK